MTAVPEVLFQAAFQQQSHARVKIRRQGGEIRFPHQHRSQGLGNRFSFKQMAADQHLEQHDPERPYVRMLVDGLPFGFSAVLLVSTSQSTISSTQDVAQMLWEIWVETMFLSYEEAIAGSMASPHLTGTRCLSSSNQLMTMLILRGPTDADSDPAAAAGLIIKNLLPSGWMSQLLKKAVLGMMYVP